MVYVVKKDFNAFQHIVSEYWRPTRWTMSGSTKRAEEISLAGKSGWRDGVTFAVAALLTEMRVEKYPYLEENMYPMVEQHPVELVFKEADKNWPPAKGEEEQKFWDELFNQLVQLTYDDALDKRNTESRRARVMTGELEPTEEDRIFFAEQARQLQEQAQRYGKLGGTKVDYLVKGGRTEIEI